MRYDNPIEQSWFSFPDLAAFPEYSKETRNDKDININLCDSHVYRNDINSFIELINESSDYRLHGNLLNRVEHYFNVYQVKRKSIVIENNPCFDALYQSGIFTTSIDVDPLGCICEPLVSNLLQNKDWQPLPGTYDRGQFLNQQKVIDYIQRSFEEKGIIDGVSAYHGVKRQVKNVYLHVSTPTDFHYKQFFRDASLTPRWTNTHIDPKEDAMKAIIYLNNVGINDGPFSYIPTSNRFVYSPTVEIFGRAISTGNYCQNPIEREPIFRLPKQVRVSYNFGRSILDDSDIASELDDRVMRVTSDFANVMVFDAGAGMHQGGVCKTGNRIALQVLMK